MKKESSKNEPAEPVVKQVGRFNRVWIIPIVALFLGLWLVKRNYDEKGEVIYVTFLDADGLSANKTEIKCRNVQIGMVESIRLNEDLSVEVALRIKPDNIHFLRDDSNFWVVRPRVQGASISGLGTLISGAYIEIDPGLGKKGKRTYVGLETPPLTPASVPGIRLTMISEHPGSIDIGSGIYFRDTLVGKIESREFKLATEEVEFGVFVDDRYRSLVTERTLFWRTSGLTLEVGADGFNLELPSIDSLVSGRISMGFPKGVDRGDQLGSLSQVKLFASRESAVDSSFQNGGEFLILADQSLRGLRKGAPVEFRGLRVGRVGEISYNLVKGAEVEKIPILIQLDTRLLVTHFPPALLDGGPSGFEEALNDGLRASLKSSSFITGQLYVDLDYYPDLPSVVMGVQDNRIILPTIDTGLDRLQDQVSAVLDKVNNLEIDVLLAKVANTSDEATLALSSINKAMTSKEGIVADSKETLTDMRETLKSLNAILGNSESQAIPSDLRKTLATINSALVPLGENGVVYGDLRRTLDELRASARSIDRMTTEIADKPNSILFGKEASSKRIPRAR